MMPGITTARSVAICSNAPSNSLYWRASDPLEALSALPLEKRYVWRVASALKWAFVDFDSLNVKADRETMSEEDRTQLVELLRHRPLQFCIFLSTLLGQKNMELMMLSAIKNTRAMAAQSNAAAE
jgi:hypothetical protein